MLTAERWLKDIPCQFRGKKNIEILINAFAKQIDELIAVFQSLNTVTDLDSASGKTLDMIGSIVNLSRKDASEMMLYGDDTTISDTVYKMALMYANYQNTSDGTYESMMSAVKALFPDYHITYTESPDVPATVRLDIKKADLQNSMIFRSVPVKPAGVKLNLYFDKDLSNHTYVGMAYKTTKKVTPTDTSGYDPLSGVSLLVYTAGELTDCGEVLSDMDEVLIDGIITGNLMTDKAGNAYILIT